MICIYRMAEYTDSLMSHGLLFIIKRNRLKKWFLSDQKPSPKTKSISLETATLRMYEKSKKSILASHD